MRRGLLLCAIIALLLGIVQPTDAQSEDTIAIITSPTANSQVSGQVQIVGSAAHPSLYAGYELEFDNLLDANEIWIPIGQRITQQITNGVLGVWDTVGGRVADGQYQLRLRVFLSDGSEPVAFVVGNVQVVNSAPTPLPSIAPDQPTATQALPPTAGPSPTPLVIQPPTNTPRSSVSAVNPTNPTNTTDSGRDISINFGSVQGAFCNGILIGLGFLAVFGAYLALRARLRPTVRQMWWQIRNELDQDR